MRHILAVIAAVVVLCVVIAIKPAEPDGCSSWYGSQHYIDVADGPLTWLSGTTRDMMRAYAAFIHLDEQAMGCAMAFMDAPYALLVLVAIANAARVELGIE